MIYCLEWPFPAILFIPYHGNKTVITRTLYQSGTYDVNRLVVGHLHIKVIIEVGLRISPNTFKLPFEIFIFTMSDIFRRASDAFHHRPRQDSSDSTAAPKSPDAAKLPEQEPLDQSPESAQPDPHGAAPGTLLLSIVYIY